MNGHITSIIHSKKKVAEQLLFSVDVCQTIGNLAEKLVKIENDATLFFLSFVFIYFAMSKKYDFLVSIL